MESVKISEVAIKVNPNQLPLYISYEGKNGKKVYVLKANNDGTKLLLNK